MSRQKTIYRLKLESKVEEDDALFMVKTSTEPKRHGDGRMAEAGKCQIESQLIRLYSARSSDANGPAFRIGPQQVHLNVVLSFPTLLITES